MHDDEIAYRQAIQDGLRCGGQVMLPGGGKSEHAAPAPRPLADVLEPGRAMTRFNTRLSTSFAALALLLSAIGVYGLTAGEVAGRWREIAVRIALGASPRGVLWTVIRPCAGVILAGSAAGIAGALAVAPLLASLLHGVDPADRSLLATAPAVLMGIGMLAALLASARILWVAPAETLRSE
jgi:ABC-type antimicrobial peptide transport system permease subunit